ncbi:MAG: hypothetical protein OQK51_25085, partial [Kangiellaceae bacterium]|nr:hypothetical protein [Kangiellaceae bacterium]
KELSSNHGGTLCFWGIGSAGEFFWEVEEQPLTVIVQARNVRAASGSFIVIILSAIQLHHQEKKLNFFNAQLAVVYAVVRNKIEVTFILETVQVFEAIRTITVT